MNHTMSAESDDKDATPAKKIKAEWSKSYSNKAMEMMKKMGYEKDKGLGKQSQGILEPLTPLQHDGRKGLGLKLLEIQQSEEIWNSDLDILTIPEHILWLSDKSNIFPFSFDTMVEWICFDDKKNSMNEETIFCDPEILTQILQSKSTFDEIDDNNLRKARSRSNPFETIRNSIFLNRAAVKMANIDSLCDFMFTNPKDKSGNPIMKNKDLLYFADLCAGPGGFSEYILYRKSWEAKGFGFTLRGPNDFTLDKFFAGSPESFDPYYGIKDDGNILDEENQNSFAEYVLKHSPAGVHFVMADGGFSVEGQENIQEMLSKQLYLCQCLTALKILRPQGHFACKLFDLFTPFSVALVFLMYKSFEKIAIIKPNSSRPANSERYLICKWKKEKTYEICRFLDHINQIFNDDSGDKTLTEIVDIEIIKSDTDFFKYIYESNNLVGQNQIRNLRKIAVFCNNNQLKDTRQAECRKQCLELWKLPDKLRQAPEVKSIDSLLEHILGCWFTDKVLFTSAPTDLRSLNSLANNVDSIYDWYFVPIGREETNTNTCCIFLSKSRGNLLRYTIDRKWEPFDYFFEIPYPSLFYGELVYEYSGEGKTQTRICSLHIIDAVMLGGIDIRRLKLSDRVNMCFKFSQSVNKPFKDGKANAVRSKPLYKLTEIEDFFRGMKHYNLKDNSVRLGLSLNSQGKFFVPGGILLLCEICHNFFSTKSKTTNILYYFDKAQKKSYYVDCMPTEVKDILYASFRNSFLRRLMWKWTSTLQVQEECNEKESDFLYRSEIQTFLKHKIMQ